MGGMVRPRESASPIRITTTTAEMSPAAAPEKRSITAPAAVPRPRRIPTARAPATRIVYGWASNDPNTRPMASVHVRYTATCEGTGPTWAAARAGRPNRGADRDRRCPAEVAGQAAVGWSRPFDAPGGDGAAEAGPGGCLRRAVAGGGELMADGGIGVDPSGHGSRGAPGATSRHRGGGPNGEPSWTSGGGTEPLSRVTSCTSQPRRRASSAT